MSGTAVDGGPAAVDHDGAAEPLPAAVYGLDLRPTNSTCNAFSLPTRTGRVHLVDRFPRIALDTPTGLFRRPDDDSRWYVTERAGRVVHFPNTADAKASDLVVALDLRAVTFTNIDCSLAGIAFPPDFETSKSAYIGYCYRGPETGDKLQQRVSRFTTNDGGATFDIASERVVVALDFPYTHPDPGFHAVDALRFGPDGLLYLALGDGGPNGGVGGGHAQDLGDLRGKLLRIDVSDTTKSLTKDFVAGRQRTAVDIPADNPFVGVPRARPEIYAYGFRNPWQFQFDGDRIWLGDVGYGEREEIDRDIKKGGNYGWGVKEGTLCTSSFYPNEGFSYPDAPGCDDPGYLAPFLEYPHRTSPTGEQNEEQTGLAVTGGVVYRGSAVPSLTGAYLFGDSSRGRIWAVRDVDALPPGPPVKQLLLTGAPVSAFAQDLHGEVFVAKLFGPANTGRVYALVEEATPIGGSGGPPKWLSETGCFDEGDPTTPVSALIPYHPIAELWSDGAAKRRWLALPETTQAWIDGEGDFLLPVGSVVVKEFSLGARKVETRFLVRQQEDAQWAGYTYAWNEQQTDAELVGEAPMTSMIEGQAWTFPGRSDCHRCHTDIAGTTLGLELAQLNHDMVYPSTGRTANQLLTLSKVGLIPAVPESTRSLPAVDGPGSVEERARAYLHVNCSNCHRHNGPTFTPPDLRFRTPLAEMGICDKRPTIDDLSNFIPSEPRLLAPGAPERSVLWVRLSTVDPGIRMPPLGRTITHTVAADVVSTWIANTTACPR